MFYKLPFAVSLSVSYIFIYIVFDGIQETLAYKTHPIATGHI